MFSKIVIFTDGRQRPYYRQKFREIIVANLPTVVRSNFTQKFVKRTTAFAVRHMHYKEDSERTESQNHKEPPPSEEPSKEEYNPKTDSHQLEYG